MAVTRFEEKTREVAFDGQSFGEVGRYEVIRGVMHVAVDPNDADSKLITDIGMAPAGADGKVHFEADVEIMQPLKPLGGSTLLVDFVNRGNRTALGLNSPANVGEGAGPEAANGFLMRYGFTVMFCGWETDVVPERIGLRVPEAVDPQGKRLVGKAHQQYTVATLTYELPLADARPGLVPLSTADLDDPGAQLIEREWSDGPAYVLPRDSWQFARWVDGAAVPDDTHVCLPTGFQPGKVYEIIYNTVGAPVIGLGFLALRDCPAFLRYGSAADGNPCAGRIDQAIAYGVSQSGRTLREFMYLGFNRDEAGRLIFEGMMPHIASSRHGEFNIRFGQPSSNHLRNTGNVQALTYAGQSAPLNGITDSIFNRLSEKSAVPKLIATNSGVEYWWSGANLTHMDPAGSRDLELPDNVRVYSLAGTKHGAGTAALIDHLPGGLRQRHWSNTLDYRPAQRAALLNLVRWIREGVEPPASLMPRVSDGTAVVRESVAAQFTSLPNAGFLTELPQRRRLDFGEEMVRGVPDYPPGEGEPFAIRVSALDADRNEVAGIRMPEIMTPLGTHMGWAARHAESGAEGHLIPLQGSFIPFPRTREEAESLGDPRASLEQRYGGKDGYLKQVRSSAESLVAQRLLLPEDVDAIVQGSDARWEAVQAAPLLVPGAAE